MADLDRICGIPFSDIIISSDSTNKDLIYSPCCQAWLRPPYSCDYSYYVEEDIYGNFDIENIWNSEKIQEFRRSIISGTYRYCNLEICPYWKSNMLLPVPEEAISYIEQKQTNLSYAPVRISANVDRTCNFFCPSCRNVKFSVPNIRTYNRLSVILSSGVRDLYLNGSGEIFFNSHYLRMMREFSSKKYPDVRSFDIISNGLNLNRTMWYSLSVDFKRLIKAITISIDAINEETYKKIRLGGDFSIVRRNAGFISELRKKGELKNFNLAYVLQKENINELPDFVKYAIDLGIDTLCVNKVENWGHIIGNHYRNRMELPLNWKKMYEDKIFEAEALIKTSKIGLFSNVLNVKS